MLIDPPIDKLIEKVGCRYALVSIVSKRAHNLQQRVVEQGDVSADNTFVSMAAKDLYEEINSKDITEEQL